MRRKLAERGLQSTATATGSARRPALSDGQRRMWFVQAVDPTGAMLNICLSYRLTGALDVGAAARRRERRRRAPRDAAHHLRRRRGR